MDKIKFLTTDGKKSFEFPWEWVEKGGLKPKTNDIEATAKRGRLNAYLYRKRQAQIPDHTLQVVKSLYRFQILDLLEIIKQEELNVYYFDHWANKFVTTKFYVPKPDLSVEKIPYDNDTGNILYAPFTIEFISYGDVS